VAWCDEPRLSYTVNVADWLKVAGLVGSKASVGTVASAGRLDEITAVVEGLAELCAVTRFSGLSVLLSNVLLVAL